jgi:hypothetical protein
MSENPSPSDSSWLASEPRELDVERFFEDLGAPTPGEREVAKRHLRAAVGGSDQPSPRASPWVDSGEWDLRDVCVLVRLSADECNNTCRAEIGSPTTSSNSFAPSPPPRFCASEAVMLGGTCSTPSHKPPSQLFLKPGYYISTSAQHHTVPRKGVHAAPCLALGPPFTSDIDKALVPADGGEPFTLTLGQWKYVFGEVEQYRAEAGRPQAEGKPADGWADGEVSYDELLSAADVAEAMVDQDQKPNKKPVAMTNLVVTTTLPPAPALATTVEDLVHRLTLPLLQRLADAERERSVDATRIAQLTADLKKMKTATMTTIGSVGKLKQQFVALEATSVASATNTAPAAGRPTPGEIQALVARLNRTERALFDTGGAFHQMRVDLSSLGEKVEMGGVEFGDFRFGSPEELFGWIKKRHPAGNPDYGLVWDGFSKLHALDPGTRTMTDALAEEHAAQKVKYRSELAARVSTSYMTNIPDVFGKPASAVKTFGPAMNSVAGWHDRDENIGLKVIIRDGIDESIGAVKGAIDTELANNQLRELATGMLVDTKQFVLDLVRFVDDYFFEVSTTPAISEADAWTLVSSMLGEVLTEMRVARNQVKHSRVTNELYHIWGALKAHEVMRRYSKAGFKNDPAMAGVVVRFLMKRKTDIDGLSAVNRKMTAADGKLATALTDIRTLKADVKRLKE